jgi:hypothetical protein
VIRGYILQVGDKEANLKHGSDDDHNKVDVEVDGVEKIVTSIGTSVDDGK